MAKSLSEMTLQELWQIFPIFLIEHQECWEDWFMEEAAFLHKILTDEKNLRISHVGSTAISAIWAKPIIDILVEVPKSCDMGKVKRVLIQKGYICMAESENRISLNKGYTENGFAEKVFHLHLRYVGGNHELYFRDFLNENSALAKEYEALKLCLWKRYEHDRDGYTEAKTAFVLECTQRAKEEYGNKYC